MLRSRLCAGLATFPCALAIKHEEVQARLDGTNAFLATLLHGSQVRLRCARRTRIRSAGLSGRIERLRLLALCSPGSLRADGDCWRDNASQVAGLLPVFARGGQYRFHRSHVVSAF